MSAVLVLTFNQSINQLINQSINQEFFSGGLSNKLLPQGPRR